MEDGSSAWGEIFSFPIVVVVVAAVVAAAFALVSKITSSTERFFDRSSSRSSFWLGMIYTSANISRYIYVYIRNTNIRIAEEQGCTPFALSVKEVEGCKVEGQNNATIVARECKIHPAGLPRKT
jgi:uncharacterized protein (UPF0333 family)